ncbi:MAG: peptidoglycan DD-metalloendopeptidase family protein [Candidatus Omnitrophota bacterium]
MRIFMACLVAFTLTGCATTKPRSARSHVDPSTSSPSMIIHQEDMEPSVRMPAKPSAAPAKSARAIEIRHTVRAGETLWAISKLYGVDLNVLADENSLKDSRSIETGQVLTIPGAASRRPVRNVNYKPRRSATFIWPVRGNIASNFGSKIDKFVNKGIDIRAEQGSSVAASRGGKIVYCDSRLKGFGKTVIIDHMDGFQTVYSYNDGISVRVGDIVEQRDVIAKVGSSGRAREPMLHFEIRKNGEPQNPEFYLSR